MSQIQVLSKETAKRETLKLLKQHEYVFLGSPNDEIVINKKVKQEHSRAIQLLIACGDIYVKMGGLSSGKQDKFGCFRC